MPPDAHAITHTMQQALALVTYLVEGGLDPFSSHKAEATMPHLVEAQDALEEAARRWAGLHQRPAKKRKTTP